MKTLIKVLVALVVVAVIGVAGFFAWALSVPAIDPITPPARTALAADKIEAGELLAAIGDCVVCHTAEGGQKFAGGRPLPTPFGVIHSTNITPDADTGIGTWSEDAFGERCGRASTAPAIISIRPSPTPRISACGSRTSWT